MFKIFQKSPWMSLNIPCKNVMKAFRHVQREIRKSVLVAVWVSIIGKGLRCVCGCENLGESQKMLMVSLGIVLAGFMQGRWFSWGISPKRSSYSRLMVNSQPSPFRTKNGACYCMLHFDQENVEPEICKCLGWSAVARDGLCVWVVCSILCLLSLNPKETFSLLVHTSGKK